MLLQFTFFIRGRLPRHCGQNKFVNEANGEVRSRDRH